ncbi:hypothetical protein MPLB_1510013 [Mesorhizobium sp. ORS 3324]|nr:hypothetical protein MPLB_1510013 [Mesorhizobium sp. ORS 3324]
MEGSRDAFLATDPGPHLESRHKGTRVKATCIGPDKIFHRCQIQIGLPAHQRCRRCD